MEKVVVINLPQPLFWINHFRRRARRAPFISCKGANSFWFIDIMHQAEFALNIYVQTGGWYFYCSPDKLCMWCSISRIAEGFVDWGTVGTVTYLVFLLRKSPRLVKQSELASWLCVSEHGCSNTACNHIQGCWFCFLISRRCPLNKIAICFAVMAAGKKCWGFCFWVLDKQPDERVSVCAIAFGQKSTLALSHWKYSWATYTPLGLLHLHFIKRCDKWLNWDALEGVLARFWKDTDSYQKMRVL